MNKPIPPVGRVTCDICGELDPPLYQHRSWGCRFAVWLNELHDTRRTAKALNEAAKAMSVLPLSIGAPPPPPPDESATESELLQIEEDALERQIESMERALDRRRQQLADLRAGQWAYAPLTFPAPQLPINLHHPDA